MADKTIALFYLGVKGDLDTNESNYDTELAQSLVGTTFGSVDAPLVDNNLTKATLNDSDGNRVLRDDDRGRAPEDEGITHEGSFAALDNSNLYNVTVNFTDGNTAQTSMILIQDVGGRMFLMPRSTGSSANDVLDDAPIESVTLESVAISNASGVSTGLEAEAFVTCFARGTMIDCAGGVRRVETLRPGDRVRTLDHGMQPVRAINASNVLTSAATAPIEIARGALGPGMPRCPLIVSPQHRVLVRSRIALRLFGVSEVLVAAHRLLSLPGIRKSPPGRMVQYHHLLCDRHELIRASGAWTETLLLGDMALHHLARAHTRQPLPEGSSVPARAIATGTKSRLLAARHGKNAQPLLQW